MISRRDKEQFARKLRRNQTKAERSLWYLWFFGFRPQVITPCGFIADWYNGRAKVIVELDGAPHFTKIGYSKDRKRDRHHRDKGILTIRLTNNVALRRRKRSIFKVLYLSVIWQIIGWFILSIRLLLKQHRKR